MIRVLFARIICNIALPRNCLEYDLQFARFPQGPLIELALAAVVSRVRLATDIGENQPDAIYEIAKLLGNNNRKCLFMLDVSRVRPVSFLNLAS